MFATMPHHYRLLQDEHSQQRPFLFPEGMAAVVGAGFVVFRTLVSLVLSTDVQVQ